MPTYIHLLSLAALNTVLFVPWMGRGFLFDDFGHLYVAAHETLQFGLTRASGGWFYAPLTYLSFKLDWLLWGMQPFPWAATNLVIHTANILVLYLLVLRLWRSPMGAWWAALGFALLFRANAGAVMNIASRAHPLVTLFWLLAMHASCSFARLQSFSAGLAVVACAALSLFTKESGLTVLAAIGVTLSYEGYRGDGKVTRRAALTLGGVLVAVLLIYLSLRSQAAAAPFSFSGPPCCSYVPSLSLWGYNIMFYAWWTYGLTLSLAVAVAISFRLRGIQLRWNGITAVDVLFSLLLFAIAIAPFVMMEWYSETHGYLPGVSAAIFLGIVTSSLYRSPLPVKPRYRITALVPIACLVGLYISLTIMHNQRWLRMAQTNAIVLKDIHTQQPAVAPHTFITLNYAEADPINRFPEGFGDYSFPWAMRDLYGDPTLDGRILKSGESSGNTSQFSEIRFAYIGGNVPHVIKLPTAGKP